MKLHLWRAHLPRMSTSVELLVSRLFHLCKELMLLPKLDSTPSYPPLNSHHLFSKWHMAMPWVPLVTLVLNPGPYLPHHYLCWNLRSGKLKWFFLYRDFLGFCSWDLFCLLPRVTISYFEDSLGKSSTVSNREKRHSLISLLSDHLATVLPVSVGCMLQSDP
jgi:hypothetical protein